MTLPGADRERATECGGRSPEPRRLAITAPSARPECWVGCLVSMASRTCCCGVLVTSSSRSMVSTPLASPGLPCSAFSPRVLAPAERVPLTAVKPGP